MLEPSNYIRIYVEFGMAWSIRLNADSQGAGAPFLGEV
jgi:hypothetical protein